MKHDVAFPRRILLTVLVVGVLSVYPLAVYANREMIYGIIAGCAVSVVNVLAGYLSIEYAFDRSNTAFLRIILGGMGIRLWLWLPPSFFCSKSSTGTSTD